MNSRASVLRAALGFLSLEPNEPELQLLHQCFDSWRGIGDVVAGMARQGLRDLRYWLASDGWLIQRKDSSMSFRDRRLRARDSLRLSCDSLTRQHRT